MVDPSANAELVTVIDPRADVPAGASACSAAPLQPASAATASVIKTRCAGSATAAR
jgi:hypothetical protein